MEGDSCTTGCEPSNAEPSEASAARMALSVDQQQSKKTAKSSKNLLNSLKKRLETGGGDSTEEACSRSGASSCGGGGGGAASPEETASLDDGTTPPWSWRAFVGFCGSGLLMSVAYLDPGNLEADIQAGANTGFALLWWFLLVSMGCGTAFQCLSGRLGLVTGKDLAQHCGERWPLLSRWLLWMLLEFAIVAADIQETVGCAQGLALLTGGAVPLWAGCIIVSCSAFTLLLLERWGIRYLEALFAAVIGVEAVAMAVNFFRAGVPAKEVALGVFRPTLPSGSIVYMMGALGALVMPYNLYFHSAVVVSRRPDPPAPSGLRSVLRYLSLETPLTLLATFCINLTIICVFAQGFYGTGQEIGLQAAGDLLAERFGEQFKYFWAVGLLAAGQVSTIALTYAGQLVMSGLLRVEVKGWVRMVGTRLVALVPALTVALVSQGTNKFDTLNQALNVVQSILLPFALIPVVHMAGSTAVMGPRGSFATRGWLHLFCSLVAATVVCINGYFLVEWRQQHLPGGVGVSVGWGFLMAAYYCCIAVFSIGPDRLGRWVAPRLQRVRSSAAVAASAAGSATSKAAGGVVEWAKGIRMWDPESLLEAHL